MNSRPKTASQLRIAAIYQEIRYRICTNRYPPDTILREEVLAKEYSVSRSPIRRVLPVLEHEGLVKVKHGIGTIVTRIEPEQLSEVYAVRMLLAEAAGSFIETPFPEEIHDFFKDCSRAILNLEEGDSTGFAEINIRYCTSMINMINNITLREMLLNLFFQTSRMWLLLLPSMPWKETMNGVNMEISEIIRRIELNDATGFGLAMRNHIFEGQQRLYEALAKQ
ncbi:MAG: GntR family transcriptional regulator [SAR324 cluster bacterium]|nr:GntR family transcriptional regulator [SAR324 cluster bacterium]